MRTIKVLDSVKISAIFTLIFQPPIFMNEVFRMKDKLENIVKTEGEARQFVLEAREKADRMIMEAEAALLQKAGRAKEEAHSRLKKETEDSVRPYRDRLRDVLASESLEAGGLDPDEAVKIAGEVLKEMFR